MVSRNIVVALLLCLLASSIEAFAPSIKFGAPHRHRTSNVCVRAEPQPGDPDELIARRITVEGDVQGGYYRSCVRNEAGRFRRLVGTMTPPDDTREAEIYVEGKRKMVEGFLRWCKKGDVGLSQVCTVRDVAEEEPTGLYEDFYVKTK